MRNDELDLTPDNEDVPKASLPDDEIRYAPPTQSQDILPEVDAADEYVAEKVISIDVPVTDGMDIEAALAAVSSLSDMLAEQEAAEQARIAQIEAEAQAAAERQARMEHPEQFFPVPPMSSLQRGQMASVIPALFLILVGAWLTFTLTTTKTAPDISLTIGIVLAGMGLVLLIRWLNSGRWARGALFGGLLLLPSAALLFYLLQPLSPGLERGWPLLLCCVGIATALTGLLAFPQDRRQIFPGIVLFIAGIAGVLVSTGALGSEFVNLAASLWPVAAVIVALISTAAADIQAAWLVRIAIDASRTTVRRVTGTEQYAIQLIRAIIRQNNQHQITLYFRDTPPTDLFSPSDHVTYKIIPFRRAWTHLRFAAALWQDKPDVTFVPAHTLPFAFPGRAVVTVHDLGFKYFPEAHPSHQRLYLDWTTHYSARRASIILADSQATAHDLTSFYGTPDKKIQVVYPGVEKPTIGDIETVRQKYHLPPRYFLFIGTLQPRKNIARIIQAYRLWKTAHPHDPAELVLAGGKGWLFDPAWVEGVQGVHLTGYIDDVDKGALYAGALALLFPTLYEGFGFPVIEAMHCGTSVIASNTSSLPELVGDAGLLVDPLNVDNITSAMSKLSDDETLRQTLRDCALIQAATFTWEHAAQQTLNALELAASM